MKKHWSYLSAVSVVALMQAPAFAAGVDTGGSNIDEIVVTAQKREQKLIDVPMAIAVLNEKDLKQKGIESVQDLSFAVPGLTMREDGPGSYTIFLRGLANQSGSGALVSQYLDEAPLSLNGYDQLSPVALDYERVEVLKGPQGTLYGLGSAAGTIRYITNKPKLDRVEGNVEVEAFNVAHGNFGGKASGVINMPIVKDVLALRVAGSYEKGGGWIDQPAAGIKNGNGTKLVNVRGQLLWKPSEKFQAKAMVQIHRADTRLGLGYEEPDRTVLVGPNRGEVLIPKKFNFTIYNLDLNYDLGFAQLISATTYIAHDHAYPFTYVPKAGNFSYGFVEGNDARYDIAHQFSEEVRLSSSGHPLEWTLGAFYRDTRLQESDLYKYEYAANGDLYSGGGVLIDNLYYFSRDTSKSYSLFADADYHFTNRLSLDAGIRYFHDRATGLVEYSPGAGLVQKADFHSVDPKISLSYKYTEQANVYVSYSKGFRSGGFNVAPIAPYGPENIYTAEVGTKASVAGGMLQYELAAYRTIYQDMVRRRLVFDAGGYISESSNIGRVEVKGLEAGFTVHPTEALTLNATGSYIHSVITNTSVDDAVNLPGDRTDYTPKYSFTLGANYNVNWTSDVPGFIRVDYEYRDKVTYIDRSSFEASVLPQASDSFGLLDMRIGAEIKGISVQLYGLNITDQNKSIDPYQGWANANRTRPRTVGIKTGYKF